MRMGVCGAEEEAARAYDRGMLVIQLQHRDKVHAMVRRARPGLATAWHG